MQEKATATLQLNLEILSNKLNQNIGQIEKVLSRLDVSSKLRTSFEATFKNLTNEFDKFQQKVSSGVKTKGDVTGLEKTANNINRYIDDLNRNMTKLGGVNFESAFKGTPELQEQLKVITQQMTALKESLGSLDATKAKEVADAIDQIKTKGAKGSGEKVQDLINAGEYEKAAAAIDKVIKSQENLYARHQAQGNNTANIEANIAAYTKLKTVVDSLVQSQQMDLNQLEGLDEERIKLIGEALGQVVNNFQTAKEGAANLGGAVKGATNDIVGAATETQRMNSELDQVRSRITYFFSLANSVRLFRRAVNSAYETVKELDQTMTETAVVTDFSVGDMWESLPEYSKRASELGVAINEAYKAATLYYQQGLTTNQVVGVSNETLKMARIAGIEAADATDLMTAALRGFNMEVNEANAQHINDVYSNLAAITAADTNEIGTAMSKTASIAASANMEFETTTALLSQIIETTREAPETAGTAMKTIIARFTEVKKLFSEGQLSGEDSEGEVININKIDTALKSVGLSLNGFLQGTQGIDDIFLQLAEKWDTLDIATQRYIATMAAGSRQQSRFLAMMSNYDRTMELVNAANNSAGASQEQFNKTLDSLETKLAQLKNAWDTFTMGLANNQIIKGAVDLLTGILTIANKLINVLSGGNGLAKSILSLMAAIFGLKAAKKIIFGLSGSLAKGFVKLGVDSSKNLEKGLLGSIKNLGKKISSNIKLSPVSFGVNPVELASLKAAKTSLNELTAAEQAGTATTAQLATAKNAYTAALNRTALSLTFNAEQEELVNLLKAQGIAEDQARLAVLGGINKAKIEETILDKNGNKLKGTAILMKRRKNIEDSVGLGIQNLENQSRGLGLIQKAKEYILLLFGTKARREQALATLTQAGATGVATTAQWGLNTAMLAFPIGLIIAGIAAIVAILAIVATKAREASLEFRMEKATENLKEAKEAAENAKTSFDELLSDRDEYDELQDGLKNLTEGTNEWKEALIEANAQVVELINKYPVLASYISQTNSGQYQLSNEGFEKVISRSQDTVRNTTVSSILSSADISNLNQEAASTNFNEVLEIEVKELEDREGRKELWSQYLADVDATINRDKTFKGRSHSDRIAAPNTPTGMIEERTRQLLEANDLEALREEMGYTVVEIESLIQAYHNYNTVMTQNEMALENYRDLLVRESSSLEVEDYEINGENISKQINDAFSQTINIEEIDQIMDDMASSLLNNAKVVTQKINAFNSEYDTSYSSIGDELTNLVTYYAALSNTLVSDIDEDLKKDKTELAKRIAKLEYSSLLSNQQDTFLQNLSKMGKATQKQTLAMLSKEGNDLTKAVANDMLNSEGILDVETLRQGMVESGILGDPDGEITDELVEQYAQYLGFEDSEAFTSALVKNAELAQAGFKRASELLNAYQIDFSISDNLTSEAAQNLSAMIMDVFDNAGPQAAAGFTDILNSVSDQLGSPEKIQDFVEVLNSIDVTDLDSIEGLDDMLREAGVAVDEAQVDVLQQQLIDLGLAVKRVDLTQLIENLNSLGNLYTNLVNEEQGRDFSEEDYTLLVENGLASDSDFMYNIATDAFTYLGESTDQIVTAIRTQTADLLNQGNLESRIHSGEVMSQLWANTDVNDASSLINSLQSYAFRAGDDSAFNTAAYAQTRDLYYEAVDAGNTAQQEKMFTKLQEYFDLAAQDYLDLTTNQAEQTELQNAEQRTLYQMDTPTVNSERASNLRQNANGIDRTYSSLSDDEKREYDNTVGALITQASTAGVSETKISDYKENIDALKEMKTATGQSSAAYKKLKSEVEAFERSVANTAAYNKSRDALKRNAEAVGELLDGYEDIEDSNVEEKIEQVQKMADEMGTGLKIDDSNYEDVRNLMLGIAQGSYSAYQSLIELSGKEFGIKVTAEGDFEQFATNLDYASRAFQDYMRIMEQEGEFVIEEVVVTDEQSYIGAMEKIVDKDGNVTYNPIIEEKKVGSTIQIVRPKNADEIKTTLNQSGLGEDYKPSGNKASSGSSSSKEEEDWENPYDEFYNLTETINRNLREREKLERNYNKLLREQKKIVNSIDYARNLSDQIENIKAQANTLRNQYALQQSMASGKANQLTSYMQANSSLRRYGYYDQASQQILINNDAIGRVKDKDRGEEIEKYISTLEEIRDAIWAAEDAAYDAEDTLNSLKDDLQDMLDELKQTYLDFENRVYDAIVASRQKEIDNMQEIADVMAESNNDVLTAIQEVINEQRRARDLEKSRQDIEEKQRRLSLLRRDTSGANSLEILALEEEIENLQESYTDTLVDQALEELSEGNQKAEEQRQKQIELLQHQLDYAEENGFFWTQVTALLNSAVDGSGNLNNNSALVALLEETEGFAAMSKFGKLDWLEQLSSTIAQAIAGRNEFENPTDVDSVIGGITGGSSVTPNWGQSFGGNEELLNMLNQVGTAVMKRKKGKTKNADILQEILSQMGYYNGEIDSLYGTETEAAVKKVQRAAGSYYSGSPDGIYGPKTYEAIKKMLETNQYASGGLNEFTGPAWLDGTKNKPELVLNARDTQNFIQLKDVLKDLMSSKINSESRGNTYIDVQVAVDSISSDYDVDQMVDRVKTAINEDARYRNTNAINILR